MEVEPEPNFTYEAMTGLRGEVDPPLKGATRYGIRYPLADGSRPSDHETGRRSVPAGLLQEEADHGRTQHERPHTTTSMKPPGVPRRHGRLRRTPVTSHPTEKRVRKFRDYESFGASKSATSRPPPLLALSTPTLTSTNEIHSVARVSERLRKPLTTPLPGPTVVTLPRPCNGMRTTGLCHLIDERRRLLGVSFGHRPCYSRGGINA